MTELEKIKRAKMYIEKLSNGIDPITNNKLPDDTVLNNEYDGVRFDGRFYEIWLNPLCRQRIL